jgi:hypothetical protein
MVTKDSRSKLNRLFNAVVLALVLALPLNTEVLAAYGPNAPVLEETYADNMISSNDIWHIYLKGSDPDGDLRGCQRPRYDSESTEIRAALFQVI